MVGKKATEYGRESENQKKGNDRGNTNRRKREEMSSEGGETDQKEEKVHVINIHRVLR